LRTEFYFITSLWIVDIGRYYFNFVSKLLTTVDVILELVSESLTFVDIIFQ
jgi:hypothetical protein